MQGDMIGLVTFYLILWLFRAGVMRVSLVIHVTCVNFDDSPANMSGLGIPGNVIADFKVFRHSHSLRNMITEKYRVKPAEYIRICGCTMVLCSAEMHYLLNIGFIDLITLVDPYAGLESTGPV